MPANGYISILDLIDVTGRLRFIGASRRIGSIKETGVSDTMLLNLGDAGRV